MDDPTQAILVWPAAGIGIMAALVWGFRVIPGLYLAETAISFLLYFDESRDFTLHDFYKNTLFNLASLFRAYFGAFLIKRYIGYPNALISYKDVLKFFFVVAPLAIVASTIIFGLVKYSLGYIPKNSLDWWFGDYLGLIIFSPIALIVFGQPKTIWRTRFFTVGLPILMLLFSVIFIYNKSQQVDIDRVVDNLKIKSKLVASKLEQHNNWINGFLDQIYYHYLPKGNSKNKLTTFFKTLENSNNGSNAISWRLNGEVNYIKTSQLYTAKQFDRFKKFDFNNYYAKYDNKTIAFIYTRYIEELNQFINIYSFKKSKDSSLTIIVAHNIEPTINNLRDDFALNNIKISLKLNTTDQVVPFADKSPITRFPKNRILIERSLKFRDENWTLINEPSARYLFHNRTNLSDIIAKIGFIFVGLIGVMLLIITGRSALVDIKVKERTHDLDKETKDLKNSKKQYLDLIEQHPVILWRLNVNEDKISYISSKVVDLFGYPLNQWLSQKDFWISHIHKSDRDMVRKTIQYSIQNGVGFDLRYRFIKIDGSIAWIKDSVNIGQDDKLNKQLIGLMVDESEAHDAKEGQIISENKYRTLFKHAIDPLIIINLDENSFKDANDKATNLFGLDNICGDVSLNDISPLKQPDGGCSKKGLRKILIKLEKDKQLNFEWTMLNKQHKQIICEINLVKLPQQDKNIVLANINDITEIKEHQKKINQLAYYDNLTKLPNREYFYSKFEFFHDLAKENKKFGTIIYLDLDRFKILNDSLGHQAGDKLLKMVAQRIRSVTKKHEFCARLGGDEFIVLNKKHESSIESSLENSLVKAELILEVLNEPYQLGQYEHFITPSLGISYYPFNNKSPDQIIHQADIAMYASKAKGKNTITIYQDNMVKNVGRRLKLEKAIRQAFVNNEFTMYYQPQVNEFNETLSVEALLRWDRSKELKINTEDLIDTIEQIGLTHELGYWVFDQTCSQLEKWQKQGHSVKSVAINVSAKQFHQGLFIDQLKSVIQSYKIHPSQIVLELTEAIIIEDMVSLIGKLSELKEYGIRVSLDDFGTGYSSLAYLKHLPIDQLKIDKLFVHDLSFDETSRKIVKTIIDLAHSMDIELVAEGVEIEEQYEVLKKLGCKNFQGFYFSMPMASDKLFIE